MQECSFRWTPYRADARMGLNHQMSSLSCAMNEASYLGRTLVLPPTICTDSGHNHGEACPAFDTLFDLMLLNRLVPTRLGNSTDDGGFVTLPKGCGSSCARTRYTCERYPRLERHQHGFWFQACLQHAVDTEHLARRTEALVGLRNGHYDAQTAPSLALLRSGLFYSWPLKAVARKIRLAIGGSYLSVHLRRSDKLKAAGASLTSSRDLATQPDTLRRLMRHWAVPGSTLYIGSTEPPNFFAPMASAYRLLFASNFSDFLRPITNNYAKYAVESLLFVGSDLYVETYGYTRGNYMRSCFPYHLRRSNQGTHATGHAVTVLGVTYGRACSRTCHEELHLIPPPRQSCRVLGGGTKANMQVRTK